MERARETREEIVFFPPLVRVRVRVRMLILEISPSYLVLRIRDPFGQRMTKGTPGTKLLCPIKNSVCYVG